MCRSIEDKEGMGQCYCLFVSSRGGLRIQKFGTDGHLFVMLLIVFHNQVQCFSWSCSIYFGHVNLLIKLKNRFLTCNLPAVKKKCNLPMNLKIPKVCNNNLNVNLGIKSHTFQEDQL